jgi:hypothetical protein
MVVRIQRIYDVVVRIQVQRAAIRQQSVLVLIFEPIRVCLEHHGGGGGGGGGGEDPTDICLEHQFFPSAVLSEHKDFVALGAYWPNESLESINSLLA